jgi:methylated-DNA-[protein]-cysteine S-methyltransferase
MRMIGLFTKNVNNVWFGVACDEGRVFGTSFAGDTESVLRSLLDGIPFDVPFEAFPKPSGFAEQVLTSVKEVYNGKEVSRLFPLAAEHLSAYTRKVLETTSRIPIGYVSSYGAVAKAAGGSPRSVGRVMAANPFAPIVPCHRVVRSDFTLGGYGGGIDVKLAILKREKRGHRIEQKVSVGGKQLRVFPVEFVLKQLKKKK